MTVDLGVTGSESAQPHRQPGRPRSESVQRRQYRPISDHAVALREHILRYVDPREFGIILRADIVALYADMLEERGWWEASWNPVARAFDVLTTGGAKPYAWITTKSGRKARRRCYPVPEAVAVVVADTSARRVA